jgi:hypothetical protein
MIRDLQRNAPEYTNPRRSLTHPVARKLADVVRASANSCHDGMIASGEVSNSFHGDRNA